MPEEAKVAKQNAEEKKPQQRKPDPVGFTFRQLGSLAGAIALLNLLRDLVEWNSYLRDAAEWYPDFLMALDAFRAFTRPIAQFLFGWIPALFHLSLTGAAKDYLTVGTIVLSAYVRTVAYADKIKLTPLEIMKFALPLIVLWPVWVIILGIMVPVMVLQLKNDEAAQDLRAVRVFMSVFAYTAVLIILNYALLKIFGA
jgi:hypothetical protein